MHACNPRVGQSLFHRQSLFCVWLNQGLNEPFGITRDLIPVFVLELIVATFDLAKQSCRVVCIEWGLA